MKDRLKYTGMCIVIAFKMVLLDWWYWILTGKEIGGERLEEYMLKLYRKAIKNDQK